MRTAAKDALVKLGPTTWHEVAAQLSSPDAFARNGAAEVLQNLAGSSAEDVAELRAKGVIPQD